jgi:hypothetical protein
MKAAIDELLLLLQKTIAMIDGDGRLAISLFCNSGLSNSALLPGKMAFEAYFSYTKDRRAERHISAPPAQDVCQPTIDIGGCSLLRGLSHTTV